MAITSAEELKPCLNTFSKESQTENDRLYIRILTFSVNRNLKQKSLGRITHILDSEPQSSIKRHKISHLSTMKAVAKQVNTNSVVIKDQLPFSSTYPSSSMAAYYCLFIPGSASCT